MRDLSVPLPLPVSAPPSRVRIATGLRVHPERLRQLQALDDSYWVLVRRAQGLLKEHRLGAVEVAQLEDSVHEINARKAATGFVALLEAGIDPSIVDYTIDETTGEIVRLDETH